jgi:hypothetical protein
VFGIFVVIIVFQNIFHLKIYQNNIFLKKINFFINTTIQKYFKIKKFKFLAKTRPTT